MYPYQNPDLSTEERISDLMSRMTLEEKILQTDQYYSGDFTTQDENGKVTAVDMQRFDALMQHNSVGSVQLRGMTTAQEFQAYPYDRIISTLGQLISVPEDKSGCPL